MVIKIIIRNFCYFIITIDEGLNFVIAAEFAIVSINSINFEVVFVDYMLIGLNFLISFLISIDFMVIKVIFTRTNYQLI